MNLRIFPDEILRQVSSPVEKFDSELRDMSREMLEIMRANGGIGLAAPQVGIPHRFFVCGMDGDSLFLANPRITVVEGESTMREGCLSLPGVQAEIKRHEQIIVKGYDASGIEKKFRMTGIWARVVQHEYDHLYGKLITDRTEKPGA